MKTDLALVYLIFEKYSLWGNLFYTYYFRGLFLDEINEQPTKVLEVLRQPIEDKIVTISRAKGSVTFPANFLLIGARNPCPCGFYGDPHHACPS